MFDVSHMRARCRPLVGFHGWPQRACRAQHPHYFELSDPRPGGVTVQVGRALSRMSLRVVGVRECVCVFVCVCVRVLVCARKCSRLCARVFV